MALAWAWAPWVISTTHQAWNWTLRQAHRKTGPKPQESPTVTTRITGFSITNIVKYSVNIILIASMPFSKTTNGNHTIFFDKKTTNIMTLDSMGLTNQDLVNQLLLQLYQLGFHLKAGRLGECHQHHFGAGLCHVALANHGFWRGQKLPNKHVLWMVQASTDVRGPRKLQVRNLIWCI